MKRFTAWFMSQLAKLTELRGWLSAGCSFSEAMELTRLGAKPIAGGTDSEWATNSPEAVKVWSRQAWVELPKLIYFSKFIEDGLNTIIQRKHELEGQPGDTVHFSFIRKLQGAGVSGDADLEGHEEDVRSYQDSVVIDQKRQAIRLKGRMSERRTAYSQRKVAKELLTTWLAETIDADIFAAFDLNPSLSLYGGAATSIATVNMGDFMSTALITRLKTKAKKQVPKLWPVKIGTKDYYVLIISPDQEHDLKVHDGAWAQAQREARERGDENPIFEGSVGVWDGVIVHVHENIALANNFGAGANLPGAYAMFLARQAMAFAWGEKPRWVEKEFEYANKTGFAIGAIWGQKKAVFDANDHAMISVRTYRTDV